MMLRRGLGDTGPPLMQGMKDCGGGLSVRSDLACPPPAAPLDPALIAQAQADYAARGARCKVYQQKEYAIDIAVGLLVAFALPGAWKLLALPAAVVAEVYYPRSIDCDYGF